MKKPGIFRSTLEALHAIVFTILLVASILLVLATFAFLLGII